MKHVSDVTALSLPGSVLSIGSFDGVHLGHQALVSRLVQHARLARLPAVVLTFFPHPSVVLRGRQPALYINTPDEKAELLAGLGVDYVVTRTFDVGLSHLSADAFLDLLRTHLGLRALVVGEDFALGYRREGGRIFLEQAAPQRGFRLEIVPPLMLDGEPVSSTRVREALRSGDVRRAAAYLGRPFVLPGTVVRGVGRGRKLGIPTANLGFWNERAYPAPGVYACWAEFAGKTYPAVTNIGMRPTFNDGLLHPVVEAHLLGFSEDLYDQEVRLSFVERLRDEQRFEGAEALSAQISRDIERARTILQVGGIA
jgi:riboflavin kinase/FMN adenylyltransferase